MVNNKVTEVTASLNGITQRVGNTESRINALDGKVAGAVTLQQFTEFKQSNDKFKFTVEQRSSVSNILPNSSFHGGFMVEMNFGLVLIVGMDLREELLVQ